MAGNTVQQKMAEMFAKFGDNIAIEKCDRVVTYAELEKQTNWIAHRIIKKGIQKDTFIGILLNERFDLIASVVGILKAGCVFIPLDPEYPGNRLELMIEPTDIKFIICDKENFNRLAASEILKKKNVEFICNIDDITANEENLESLPGETGIQYSPQDKVYVYFTSGTTGKPKAIVGNNKSLLHFINWEIDTFGIDETFRLSQFTNPGFDVYLRDILVPLCAGAVICIPEDKKTIVDSQQLIKWIDQHAVNLIHCVPSLFRLFNIPDLEPDKFKSLKYILFAGEKVIPKELKNWYDTFNNRIQLVNLYGPTETTLAKLFYLIQPSDADREIMPVGKCIKGARAILLDEKMNICERLVTGEIYIRTPYRTLGYYNDPRLNREKFIRNPFNNDPHDLLYKTGDLGRLLPDGNIELLGRVDRQVKIRGMRVELDEIENTLLKHLSVKEAVVVERAITDSHRFLVALITSAEKNGDNIDRGNDEALISHLGQYLVEKLPDYMIPSNITLVEKIPRKLNGKVDYDEVMNIVKNLDTEYIAPRDDIELKIQEIWSQLLGFKKIGIRNNFFELGGNSLSVMSLIAKIHKAFDTRINLGEIFNNNTIEKQAQIIKEAAKEKFTSIQITEKKEYYPLSSAQKRLFILNELEGEEATNYNLPRVNLIKNKIDNTRLEETFKKLIQRHESLRTSFLLLEEEPVQVIHEDDDMDFRIKYSQCNQEKAGDKIVEFVKFFNLGKAPLLRVELAKLDEDKHLFLVDMHHIIADGTSMTILTKEFLELYEGETLFQLKLQYKDFSEWQNKLFHREEIMKQEQYWLNRFKGEIPLLNLPTDYPRWYNRTNEGSHLIFEPSRELNDKINVFLSGVQVTKYMLLLAVFNILLSKYSRQEEIIIGSPITGRNHADLENVIGTFANMLAARNYPAKDKTFKAFLTEVKENAIKDYENQDYQFEELVARLDLKTPFGRNPLFDVVFNMVGITGAKEKKTWKAEPALNISPYESHISPKYALLLRGSDNGNAVFLRLEYATALFEKSTVEQMTKHFLEILQQVVENIDVKIKDITISHDLIYVSNINQEEDINFNF